MGNPFAQPSLATPPPTPSLTDDLVAKASEAAQRRAMMGSSLASTFLTGPLGATGPAPTSAPSAKGS